MVIIHNNARRKTISKKHVVKQAQEAQNMDKASMVSSHKTPAN